MKSVLQFSMLSSNVSYLYVQKMSKYYDSCSLQRYTSYKYLCMNKRYASTLRRIPNVIIEVPLKPVKHGLLKVLSIFVSGVTIGGYLGKNISRVLEDYQLFSVDDNEE